MAVRDWKSNRAKRSEQLQLLTAVPPCRPSALPVLDERLRGTKFVELAPRSVLNSPQQTGVDFWSLNPYIGCEFGCTYCYARYAHRYAVEQARDAGRLSEAEFRDFRGPHGWEAFERRIFVKARLVAALEADLRRYFRTGLNLGIITKSPLVARDVDLLRDIQQRSDLEVYVSLITVDARVIRQFEARSPTPAARLRALQKLTAAGINAGLIVAPVLPGVTDDRPHLEALFRAAREAGARFVHAGPLRLYPAVRDRFLPVLEAHCPDLTERYRRAYARHSGVPRPYARALDARIRRLQTRFGFPVNEGMVDRYRPRRPATQGELGL